MHEYQKKILSTLLLKSFFSFYGFFLNGIYPNFCRLLLISWLNNNFKIGEIILEECANADDRSANVFIGQQINDAQTNQGRMVITKRGH